MSPSRTWRQASPLTVSPLIASAIPSTAGTDASGPSRATITAPWPGVDCTSTVAAIRPIAPRPLPGPPPVE